MERRRGGQAGCRGGSLTGVSQREAGSRESDSEGLGGCEMLGLAGFAGGV